LPLRVQVVSCVVSESRLMICSCSIDEFDVLKRSHAI
jgi:hypothetical protein